MQGFPSKTSARREPSKKRHPQLGGFVVRAFAGLIVLHSSHMLASAPDTDIHACADANGDAIDHGNVYALKLAGKHLETLT